jgi:alpha-methylacyl-CoA racemase
MHLGPFAGLLLADNGASVLRVDRTVPGWTHSSSTELPPTNDLLTRHKSSIAVDLKSTAGITFLKALMPHVDVVIDPFRPGVLEKLGLGPDVLRGINPRIILGRMTGFRRDGRYKEMAGHDINYIAVSGTLSMLGGRRERPSPPINILGDFAGGGAMLFQGILLALLARGKSGRGQVVEANMVDGSAYLTTFPRLSSKTTLFDHPKGENMLDGGCPWYGTYETKDGKYMAVGCLEPQFFSFLLQGLGLQGRGIEEWRVDRRTWPKLKLLFEELFKEKTRLEWEEIFDGTDACVTPVLEMKELESDDSREGDQRPAVTLRETPSLAIKRGPSTRDASQGQGEGVLGDGWIGIPLRPSQGGEQVLNQWLGWKRGRDFQVESGGLVIRETARL